MRILYLLCLVAGLDTKPERLVVQTGSGLANGKVRVAVCLPFTKSNAMYFDAAVVLKYSLEEQMVNHKNIELNFVALVLPDMEKDSQKHLGPHGFRTFAHDLPVSLDEVKEPLLHQIKKSGCCGLNETVKLNMFKLTEYDRLLLMDADSLVLQPIPEILTSRDILWTNDPGLGGGCINGGFFVANPSLKVYDDLVALFRGGDFPEGGARGSAWGGSGIGWCWGGQTFQGVIPYYYKKKFKYDAMTPKWRALPFEQYDNMGIGDKPPGQHNDEPLKTPISEVKTVHMTWCQKPWNCAKSHTTLCKDTHTKWWKQFKRVVDAGYGKDMLATTQRCGRGEVSDAYDLGIFKK